MDSEAIEAIADEITEIWCHLSAATHRFLELVAEFDRAEGWAQHGLANCAQWLNLACGIGPVAAREKVRVARALESLPQVSASFRDGELSYSKVRAITRVATRATEGTLLNVALHGTASHVERLVRHYRRVQRIEEADRANEQHRSRFVHFHYDDDGSVSIYGRLPPETGALIEKAIETAVATMEDKTLPDAWHASSALETLAGTQHVADGSDPIEDEREPIGARRADGLRLLAGHFLAAESRRCESAADRFQVVVHIDQATLVSEVEEEVEIAEATEAAAASGERDIAAAPECPAALAGHARCEIEDRCSLAAETARRLACDGALVGIAEDSDGEPLDVGRKTRAISPAMKRALKSRDGGCRFPGCDRTRFTEGHHIRHWADGGETRLSNLVTLCTFHHRLVHEGGFGLRVTDDGAFIFTRPDGSRIVPGQRLRERDFDRADNGGPKECVSGGVSKSPSENVSENVSGSASGSLSRSVSEGASGSASASVPVPHECFRGNNIASTASRRGDIADRIAELNVRRGITVRRPPGWHGERMDYGLAIEEMLWRLSLETDVE